MLLQAENYNQTIDFSLSIDYAYEKYIIKRFKRLYLILLFD